MATQLDKAIPVTSTEHPARSYRQRIYAKYAENFQDAGPTFDRAAARKWGAARQWYLRKWLPADKRASILDVACGGGKLLLLFVDQGFTSVHGVDISADQVALARQVTPNVEQGDVIACLKSWPERFDLITGFDIVEHFRKDEVLDFLDAAFNALKPGGRLVLQTPNAESPWGAQHRYGDFTHEVGFNPSALCRLLRLIGLSQIEARECDPPPFGYSALSSIRAVLWQAIRLLLKGYNFVETGNGGGGVFTRVFIISGIKAG